MENFTLQLKGTKRWRLKPSSVKVPTRGCTPQWNARSGTNHEVVRSAAEQQAKLHAQHANDGAPFNTHPPREFFHDAEEVTLKPGSVLYVPGAYAISLIGTLLPQSTKLEVATATVFVTVAASRIRIIALTRLSHIPFNVFRLTLLRLCSGHVASG